LALAVLQYQMVEMLVVTQYFQLLLLLAAVVVLLEIQVAHHTAQWMAVLEAAQLIHQTLETEILHRFPHHKETMEEQVLAHPAARPEGAVEHLLLEQTETEQVEMVVQAQHHLLVAYP
jgi:hypothetical protein